MYQQGYIDKQAKEKAQNAKLDIVPLRTEINAPHFVFYVKGELEKQYGIRAVEEGGFRVTTTLDLNIQREAEKILREELDKIPNLNVTNGAVLVTQPNTGEILAMVGSVDYWKQPYGAFNVTTSTRQPGSSIKALLYGYALERGFTAASIIDDTPTTFGIAGSEPYRPVNYDGKFHGRVPFRYALANSFNIPAVKVLNSVGVFEFADQAKRMGISTWGDTSRYGLSMALGGLEVTMLDMNTAYGVFANQGERVDLNNVLKLEDSKGEELYTIDPYKTRVMDPGAAYILSDILSDNTARVTAFGPGSQLEIPGYKVSVKTGTTDNKLDNWTCGYTPEFTVCVWVGNNDNSPMNPYLASGITGAAPIWHRTMEYLLKNYGTKAWFEKPANVVERQCTGSRPEFFLAGTESTVPCRELPTANNQQNNSNNQPTNVPNTNDATNNNTYNNDQGNNGNGNGRGNIRNNRRNLN
jgi:membrane peptidoglycan carboxypeptidase